MEKSKNRRFGYFRTDWLLKLRCIFVNTLEVGDRLADGKKKNRLDNASIEIYKRQQG